jgi:predicted membrane channel-forming protein YqfA (hemolysin III family)
MKRAFDFSLIAATLTPLTFILLQQYAGSVAIITGALAGLGATHVFATSYLFSDTTIRSFIAADPLRLAIIPGVIVAISIMALLASPLWVAFVFVLIYVHYQAYHYGQQNLGVASFSSIGSRGKGMSDFERLTIRLGVLCGVLGTYHALWPALMIGGAEYPFDLS